MQNQVMQQVLVDGEYVSRPVDVYQLMARAQQQTDVDMDEPEDEPRLHIPHIGLLSRTLFSSPFVQFILPANIRREHQNDVVFVGTDAVHLYEIHDRGHFHHVASKFDFKGNILAARTFGEPRKLGWLAQQSAAVNTGCSPPAGQSATGKESGVLPPEVVVLTLSTRRLIMLWVEQASTDEMFFRHREIRLAAGTSPHDTAGTLLAVDPKCRAMAVATPEGQCTLYKTKTMNEWEDDVRAGRDIAPIQDERHIHVQARILHMEFLSAGVGQDDTHVILVFVLAHNGRTKITCYDWDPQLVLNTAAVRAERVSVDFDDHNPLLIIPATRRPDFLLVCEQHIATYTNVLSGIPKRYKSPIGSEILRPVSPGDSKNRPLWIQWERVPRNVGFAREVFYIAREDGRLIYVELLGTNLVDINHAGEWSHPLDKAFATLDIDAGSLNSRNADILVATGPASDGSLQKVGESEARNIRPNFIPGFVESIPSWAPISDLMVSRLPGIITPYERERDSIFVAHGREPHGAISELRHGLRAVVDEYSGGMKGCTGLWFLDHQTERFQQNGIDVYQHHATYLFSLPHESIAIRATREGDSWQMTQISSEYEPGQSGIDGNGGTIAAGILSDQFSIQITRRQITLLSRTNLTCARSLTVSGLTQNANASVGDITLASVASTPTPHVAVSFREDSSAVLVVIPIEQDGDFGLPIQHKLETDLTCLDLLDINGVPHVFLGGVDSSLNLYRVQQSSLSRAFSQRPPTALAGATSNVPIVCENAMLLTSAMQNIIVCGMRSGMLLCIEVQLPQSPAPYEIEMCRAYKMGATAVRINRCATDEAAAFVICGNEICRISLASASSSRLAIDSIWFNQTNDEGFQQSAITAIDQIPHDTACDVHDIGGFIFAVSGERLLLARLDYDNARLNEVGQTRGSERSKAVPLKIATEATPTRVVYNAKRRKLVVATTESREQRAPPDGYRAIQSSLKLVDIFGDTAEIKQEEGVEPPKDEHIVSEFALDHYERVNAILDWVVEDERNKPHHFLCVGTSITKGPKREHGRRLFFKIGSDNEFKLKKEKPFDKPVHSLALMHVEGRADLVSIIGDKLLTEEYDFEAKKWVKRAEKELPSFGVHLSVWKHFIYVSTALHSLCCFTYQQPEGGLVQLFTSSRLRASAHHLQLNLDLPHPQSSDFTYNDSLQSQTLSEPTNIVLVSDKTSNLAGLLHSPDRIFRNATETLFEARLPRSITRLARGDLRPPWRRPHDPFPNMLHLPMPTGIIADDILGSASDGTVYTLSILTEPALRLLKFLQCVIEFKQALEDVKSSITVPPSSNADVSSLLVNNAEGDQTEPNANKIRLRDVDPSKGQWVPTRGHVDADVLVRFFGGPTGIVIDVEPRLWKLVKEGTEEAVWESFVESVRNIGLLSSNAEDETVMGGIDGSEQKIVELTATWLEDMLMPVL